MERQDESLTTRDLAGSPSAPPPREDPRANAPQEGAVAHQPVVEDDQDEPRAAGPVTDVAAEETPAPDGSPASVAEDTAELLPEGERADFQRRWEEIQTGFVDEPRRTVEQADELVANVMKRLAEGFAKEREGLERQWGRGEDISTEDLRVALQRYRSFFQRLLSA
jgi:hypothetical protein